MTQVSRFPLPKPLEEQMNTLFRRSLADLHTEKDIGDFLDDLLTPTEKIMLGKRLAIAMFIKRGYDHRTIHRIMHVSLGTVSTVNYWLKNKGLGYHKVIDKIMKEEGWTEALERLDKILEDFFSLGKSMYPKLPSEFKPNDRLLK